MSPLGERPPGTAEAPQLPANQPESASAQECECYRSGSSQGNAPEEHRRDLSVGRDVGSSWVLNNKARRLNNLQEAPQKRGSTRTTECDAFLDGGCTACAGVGPAKAPSGAGSGQEPGPYLRRRRNRTDGGLGTGRLISRRAAAAAARRIRWSLMRTFVAVLPERRWTMETTTDDRERRAAADGRAGADRSPAYGGETPGADCRARGGRSHSTHGSRMRGGSFARCPARPGRKGTDRQARGEHADEAAAPWARHAIECLLSRTDGTWCFPGASRERYAPIGIRYCR